MEKSSSLMFLFHYGTIPRDKKSSCVYFPLIARVLLRKSHGSFYQNPVLGAMKINILSKEVHGIYGQMLPLVN